MKRIVKEDRTVSVCGRGFVRPGRKSRWSVLAAGVVLAAVTGHAIAQQNSFAVTAREIPGATQRLVVPLNGSVILETNAPIERIQVVESAIAKVETVTNRQCVLTGVGYGSTQVMLWSENGERQLLDVDVELDVELLNERLRAIDPQSDASASSLRGNIILTGTVSGPEAAEQMERFATLFIPPGPSEPGDLVQNYLMVSGQQQVLLRCTVAEVNRSAMKRLGVNGFLAGDDFQDVFAVSQIAGINPINMGAAADVNVQSTIPFLTGSEGIPLSPSTSFSLGFPRVQMQLFIDALAENSLLKVLAEPDLVALSGETASFLAGGEFPIPVPQGGSAAGAITIEFREFGVRVNFTPMVLAHEKIRLRVAPEVSETDFSTAIQVQGFVVPGLSQRRVETTVEVGNGQTIALAGLLSEEVRGIATKLPGLGEVPVLGALFRSVEYQRRESELVILVTPELIAPMDPRQVPKVPGEDYTAPNDFELYALGLLEGEAPAHSQGRDTTSHHAGDRPAIAPLRSEPDEMSLHGPWGYSTAEDL